METIEVKSPGQAKEFLYMPLKLYRDMPAWIRPLDKDIESIFDPKTNKAFVTGKCVRWIIKEGKETVGRVAAFYDAPTSKKGNDQPTGGLGFFESINDKEVAFKLFDLCKEWLQDQGMEAMDGPINFGNRTRWWGLLIDGFEHEPNYQSNFNQPYYKDLFEAYGFKVYFYQYTFNRSVYGPLSERLTYKAELIKKDPGYRFSYPQKLNLPKIADEIQQIYNKAWASRREMPRLTRGQALHLLKEMKLVMDKRLLWFGYYHDEPIAFFISIPEVNQIFKHVNGKMNLWGKIKFVWHLYRKSARKAYGVLFGIVPEHQGKGVDGGLIMEFRKLAQEDYRRYDEYEIGWIGDFHPKMIKVAEQIEAKVIKTHVTYRKLFDENKPFRRRPII